MAKISGVAKSRVNYAGISFIGSGSGGDPIKKFQLQILLYAGIRPIREAQIDRVTDVIG